MPLNAARVAGLRRRSSGNSFCTVWRKEPFPPVGSLSAGAARSRPGFKTWRCLRFATYLVAFLAFDHQLSDGADFVGTRIAQVAWYTLLLGVAAMVAWYRFAVPVRRGLRQHLRVTAVRPDALGWSPSTSPATNPDELTDEPGQFLREAGVPARRIHHESLCSEENRHTTIRPRHHGDQCPHRRDARFQAPPAPCPRRGGSSPFPKTSHTSASTPPGGPTGAGMFTGDPIDAPFGTAQISAALSEGKPTAVKVLRAPDQNGLDQQIAAYALHRRTRVAILRNRTAPPTTAPSTSGHTDFQNRRSSPRTPCRGTDIGG
ncbi:hypothetical protein [Streptomyces sp. NPDC056255]|uniref:hypothetical protein n=1 Tax=Streptomyces sp. NPDC056255 TaxID=3345764 RepID=UPI0035DD82B4